MYVNPIKFLPNNQDRMPLSNVPYSQRNISKISPKDYLKSWAETLTKDFILIPKINNKGLNSNKNYFPVIFCLKSEVNKIEKYLFGDFIKDFKNFKPTMEQFKKVKNDEIKTLENFIKKHEKMINITQKILKDPEQLKQFAHIENKHDIRSIEWTKKIMDRNKSLIEKNKTNNRYNENEIKIMKEEIERLEGDIKKAEYNMNDIKYFVDKVEKSLKWRIDNLKNNIKMCETRLKIVKDIKYEDLLDVFKSAKIDKGPHLKIDR